MPGPHVLCLLRDRHIELARGHHGSELNTPTEPGQDTTGPPGSALWFVTGLGPAAQARRETETFLRAVCHQLSRHRASTVPNAGRSR